MSVCMLVCPSICVSSMRLPPTVPINIVVVENEITDYITNTYRVSVNPLALEHDTNYQYNELIKITVTYKK